MPSKDRRKTDFEGFASRLKGGDPESIHEFLEAFGSVLRRLFLWDGLPTGYAEDLAIECAEDIVLAIDGYESRPGSKFFSWCMIIARNKVTDWRRGRRGPGNTSPNDATISPDRGSDAQSKDDSAGGVAETVNWAMRQLSEEDREIIQLRHFESANTDREIAAFLGISPGAVRVRHHRAIHRLEQLLRSNPQVQEWLNTHCDKEQGHV
jgi:RNA polymerase sigma factor (sigma-70 family)